MKQTPTPWCIAHRGASRQAPENTGSAFQQALTYPIDGIELDVQMSADGVPVLYHDRTLMRVAKQRKRIADWTFERLDQLDWGAWFDPAFKGEPLLTLAAALAKWNRCPHWFIEIKSRPPDQASGHAYHLAERVAAMIMDASGSKLHRRAAVLSFDPHVLATARKQAPELKYVLNLAAEVPIEVLQQAPIKPSQLWGLCVKISQLSEHLAQWARSHGLKVLTYTCNGPRQVQKALALRVDAILSDRPGWLTNVIKGDTGI